MSNKLKNKDIKSHTRINIELKNFSPKIFLFTTLDMQRSKIWNFEILKIDTVNPLYFIINKVNGYFKEINKNKYLTLVCTNEIRQIIKRYAKMWIEIRDLIRWMTKNLDDYDKKYMKIKFNLDDELPLNKKIFTELFTEWWLVGLFVRKMTNIIDNFPQMNV